mgnify:CR=1 FL=1
MMMTVGIGERDCRDEKKNLFYSEGEAILFPGNPDT